MFAENKNPVLHMCNLKFRKVLFSLRNHTKPSDLAFSIALGCNNNGSFCLNCLDFQNCALLIIFDFNGASLWGSMLKNIARSKSLEAIEKSKVKDVCVKLIFY